MKKRLFIIFIALLFIIAFVPALEQPADASLIKANPIYDAYDQFVALTNTSHDFGDQHSWFRAFVSLELPYTLPSALPASSDPRAPPV